MQSSIYVDECTIHRVSDPFYIFGVCREANDIINIVGEDKIIAFVDNNKYGNVYRGKRIINVEELVKKRNSSKVIIATSRFSNTILKQLDILGLNAGNDVFIWDNENLFCFDDNIDMIIRKFNTIWKKDYTKYTSGNEILIPFDNIHISAYIKYAYMANYLANREEAQIKCFCKAGFDSRDASTTIREIFKSFNVTDVIDNTLSLEQEENAKKITESIWNELYNWYDWKRISIFNIHFGTTIIRDFFRRMIPTESIRDQKMKDFLYNSVKTIVFWKDYFDSHKVKGVIMSDGTHWDGYIRDIAISHGVPTYSADEQLKRLTTDYAELYMYQYFDKMWDSLTPKEQAYGIRWAKKHLDERLNGDTKEVALADKQNFVFSLESTGNRVLNMNSKTKVLICPHSFDEDCYWYGEHLFADNYYSWLCHLGELSKKTDYEWYLKDHPSQTERDKVIIRLFLDRYPHILHLQSQISPRQLRNEGIRFAFTESGTLGHEYPAIGIEVINAGINPHSKFDFCWNPNTVEEFDQIVLNLERLQPKDDKEGLLKFYSMKYLFYDWEYIPYKSFFFQNPLLSLSRKGLKNAGYDSGTWIYSKYLEEFSETRHRMILNKMEELFRKMDEWRPDVLYKRDSICIDDNDK